MIITFTQLKGGVGKSTIAINLAVALAHENAKVGLLDSDSQLTAHNWHKRRERDEIHPSIECQYVQGNLKDTLQAMSKRNDVVLVDTAGFKNPSFGPAVVNSDIAIFPFAPKAYDLEVAQRLITHDSIESASMLNPRLKLRAVLNSCPTNANDSRANEAQEYLEKHGYTVFKSRLCRRESYGDTGQTGHGVTEYNDKKAIKEINGLLEEIKSAKTAPLNRV